MLVEINNLVKNYDLGKTSVKALRSVNFKIEKGDFVSIVGPSGSGKTTLLNLIGCLDVPNSGEIIIDGQNIAQLNDNKATLLRLHKIGFIFQSFNLVPVLNVYENTEFPLMLLGVKPAERAKRIKTILERVGLSEYIKHKPDELSGGQRQRVAICRALVHNPSLVLADEPTANLDSETGEMIIKLMMEMNRDMGVTFIFSTHDSLIMKHARKKIFLHDGIIEKIER
jgi:putative ABC transport system ATP-binding protein